MRKRFRKLDRYMAPFPGSKVPLLHCTPDLCLCLSLHCGKAASVACIFSRHSSTGSKQSSQQRSKQRSEQSSKQRSKRRSKQSSTLSSKQGSKRGGKTGVSYCQLKYLHTEVLLLEGCDRYIVYCFLFSAWRFCYKKAIQLASIPCRTLFTKDIADSDFCD